MLLDLFKRKKEEPIENIVETSKETRIKEFTKEVEKGEQFVLIDGWLPVRYRCVIVENWRKNINCEIKARLGNESTEISIVVVGDYYTFDKTDIDAIKDHVDYILSCRDKLGFKAGKTKYVSEAEYAKQTTTFIDTAFKNISDIEIGDLFVSFAYILCTQVDGMLDSEVIYKVSRVMVTDKENISTYKLSLLKYNIDTKEYIPVETANHDTNLDFFVCLDRFRRKIDKVEDAFDLFKE